MKWSSILFLFMWLVVVNHTSVVAQERQTLLKSSSIPIKRQLQTSEVLSAIAESFYYGKQGFPESKSYAAFWFRVLAELGYEIPQYNLGVCYYLGEGVAQDKDSAISFFRMAAQQGLDKAQYNTALCYLTGEGVKQDSAEALSWYKKAFRKEKLSKAETRDLGKELYGKDISHLYRQIIQTSANAELSRAWIQNAIGESFYSGLPGFPQDRDKAFSWFRLASNRKYGDAQANLGVCFFFGDGVELNKDSAVYWFRQAAERGIAAAQCNLALCYFFADGVEKDNALVVHWYQQAALKNYPLACNNLGYCYELGIGTAQNSGLAERYYRLAAQQGYAKAQFNLAAFYYEEETPSTRKKAFEWLEKAAWQGYTPAVEALESLKSGKSALKFGSSKGKPVRYGLEKELRVVH